MFSIIKIVKVLKVVLIPFVFLIWMLFILMLLGYIFPDRAAILINTSLKFQIFNSIYTGFISEVVVLLFLAFSVTFVFLVCKLILNYYSEKIHRIILEPIADGDDVALIVNRLKEYGTTIYSEYGHSYSMRTYIKEYFQRQIDLLNDSKDILEFLEKNQKDIDKKWLTNYEDIYNLFKHSLSAALKSSIKIRRSDFFLSWFTLLFLLFEKRLTAESVDNTITVKLYESWIEQLWTISWEPSKNESPARFSLRLKENFQKAKNKINPSLNEEQLKEIEKMFINVYSKSWGDKVMPYFESKETNII